MPLSLEFSESRPLLGILGFFGSCSLMFRKSYLIFVIFMLPFPWLLVRLPIVFHMELCCVCFCELLFTPLIHFPVGLLVFFLTDV